jgi:putative holliday junction resolvase
VSATRQEPAPVIPACVMAFDVGRRRIGIATADTLTRTARPRATVAALAHGPDWAQLTAHVKALAPQHLVVGLPTHADGTPSQLAPLARRFAAELAARFGLPVSLVDEHGSSLEAQESLRQERRSGRRRRRVQHSDIDSHAAAVILGRWLAGEALEGKDVRA